MAQLGNAQTYRLTQSIDTTQPTTYPNNTTANRNTAPQEQEDPQPTTKDAMSEIKFLRIIIQAQHDRIEKLEQKEKRTADVLEALTKLALGTAQNTGGENVGYLAFVFMVQGL